jgi:hypothetical protein
MTSSSLARERCHRRPAKTYATIQKGFIPVPIAPAWSRTWTVEVVAPAAADTTDRWVWPDPSSLPLPPGVQQSEACLYGLRSWREFVCEPILFNGRLRAVRPS